MMKERSEKHSMCSRNSFPLICCHVNQLAYFIADSDNQDLTHTGILGQILILVEEKVSVDISADNLNSTDYLQ